jgi:hypothetical protein
MNFEINTQGVLIVGICLALIVAAIIRFFPKKVLGEGPTEAKLRSLFLMSKESAVEDSMATVDWRDIALESQKLTQEAKSYCSHTIVKDSTAENLAPTDHIVGKWRLDFVNPDRYHITQELWDVELGDIHDEWVTIGRENYENAGLWRRTDDGVNDEQNMALRVDSMLDILRNEEPIVSEVYQYEGRRYLILNYGTPLSGGVSRGFPLLCKDLKGTCEIQTWISLETGLFVKGKILYEGETPDGEFAQGEVHQMFTCYDEDVNVSPPPWINVAPDSEGNLRVVNQKVPILRHHQ